jgi:hypothetical protein
MRKIGSPPPLPLPRKKSENLTYLEKFLEVASKVFSFIICLFFHPPGPISSCWFCVYLEAVYENQCSKDTGCISGNPAGCCVDLFLLREKLEEHNYD